MVVRKSREELAGFFCRRRGSLARARRDNNIKAARLVMCAPPAYNMWSVPASLSSSSASIACGVYGGGGGEERFSSGDDAQETEENTRRRRRQSDGEGV